MRRTTYAPGRVNLIGDHTDYTGGLVLPMAIDRGITVEFEENPAMPWIEMVSPELGEPAVIELGGVNPATVQPHWARFVAAVAEVVRPTVGGMGIVQTTLPMGAGLASSAALEVALALAFGFEGDRTELALACQRAEHMATGVPCGIMDQLSSVAGVEDHALLIDCSTLDVNPVPLPDGVDVVVVHSGARRALVESAYAARRTQCEEAADLVGPLRNASLDAVEAIDDELLRRRARHVVTENGRVTTFAAALEAVDLAGAGQLMLESHASLRDDFDVSTRALDALVDELVATPGVYGARLTGAGFGGCVVALAEAGTDIPDGRVVRASAGATLM